MKEKRFYKDWYPENYEIFKEKYYCTEGMLEPALKRLEEINPGRKETDRGFLKENVEDVCFIAFLNRMQRGKDFTQKGREKNKAFQKDLQNFIDKYPHVKDYNLPPPSIHQNQSYLLTYREPIKKQQETKNPEINTLLFQLVFLFRKFSDSALKNGEWRKNLSGPMHGSGDSYYDIVTDIINAVINPKGAGGELRKKELTIKAVRERIRNLIPQVKL